MNIRVKLAVFAAASVVSAAAIIPTSGVSAQGWERVSVNRTREVLGNGQVVSQQRAVADFRGVSLGGSGNLIVRVGPRHSLTVTADSNILPALGHRIRDGILILEPLQSYRTRNQPRYVITVPTLTSVAIGGSGNGQIDGIASDQMSLTIGGSGSMTATGRTGRLSVTIGGSGRVDARALRAASVATTIGGSGTVLVATNGPISGTIAGSGSVRYLGRPSAISVTRVGSGTVAPLR